MKAHKKTLKNGLRVITIPMKDSPAVTVYVMVEAGTNYEEKKFNGISHFLEHVMFKGTFKRPSAHIITGSFDSIGAEVNAFTDHEYTVYYSKAAPKHLSTIVDVLSDMYLNSTFPDAEIEKEKGVIIQEINMYEDQPDAKASMAHDALLYGDQGAGWPVSGPKETVQRITPDDFRRYRSQHYVASSTIVVVAGNFDEKKTINLVEKQFASISTSRKVGKKKVVAKQSTPAISLLTKKTDQTHIVLGVRAFPVTDKRKETLSVLSTVLGRGMSSRLFRKMREEMGVCYYVYTASDTNSDYGSFAVKAGVDPKRSLDSVEAILEEFRRLKNELVSQKEIDKAKEFLVGHTYLSLETSDALAGYYGSDEILRGKLENPKEWEKKIRAVTARDVQKVAREIFQNKGLNLTVVGQTPPKAKLKGILKI